MRLPITVGCFLYIFFASWSNAYKLGRYLPIPNLLAIFLSIAFILYLLSVSLRIKFNYMQYRKEDLLLLLCLFMLSFSGILHLNEKTINYLLAYSFTFIISYLLLKGVFCKFVTAQNALKVNSIAILFVSLFLVVEFGLRYFFSFNIQDFIPRTVDAQATYLTIFNRSYGFSNEPTNVAMYLNILAPIGLWQLWMWRRKHKLILKLFLTFLVVFGWLTTFSAAAVVSLTVSMFLSVGLMWLCNPQSLFRLRTSTILCFFVVVVCVISIATNERISATISEFAQPIIQKITLQRGGEGSRISRWQNDIQEIEARPVIGHGPGYRSSKLGSSSVNWYLFILLEGGIASLIPLLLFIGCSALRILNSFVPGKYFFLVGFLAGAIHLSAVSTFYDPFLWLLLILFYVTYNTYKQRTLSVKSGFQSIQDDNKG